MRESGEKKKRSSPPRRGGYGLEVCAAGVGEVLEDVRPVVARVPGDARGRVDLDGHDLGDFAALDEDDRAADAAALPAAVLAPADVLADERVVVGHVRPRDDVRGLDRESVMRRRATDRRQ